MLSLRSIINNISKGQSAISTRLILQALESNYQQLRGYIILNGVTNKDNKPTIFTLMPSSKHGIYYDIVVQFQNNDKITLDSPFQIYSNSPGFVYNFAYVFHKNGSLLFPYHYPTEVLTMPPEVRNPFESSGFDKHCYAILRYVTESKIETFLNQASEHMPQVKTVAEKFQQLSHYDEEIKKQKSLRKKKRGS